MDAKRSRRELVLLAACVIVLSPGLAWAECVVPDNGGGTVTLPPAGCPYLSPTDVHRIVAGLPPGTSIELGAIHQDFICLRSQQQGCSFPTPVQCTQPGGAFPGGEQECARSSLQLTLRGTGTLGGWQRTLNLPVDFETHVGPRMPFQPIQSFDTSMFRLFGQLPLGDPDFDLLRISAGTAFGLPSPGHTTLTQRPTGWAVDSFFDITYRIDFVGRPGGNLAGRSGSTTGTIRMSTTGNGQCQHGALDCDDANVCTNDSCVREVCREPDNGAGTANLPPQGCSYVSPADVHKIINGLPPGTTIEVGANHAGFLNIVRGPGGAFPGGEREQFSSILSLQMTGTGGLAGYSRPVDIVIQCESHVGARVLGAPVQSFPNDMFALQGQIIGDPDFDLLRITGGTSFGMPSPGHTTLARQPDGTWAIDSFFDITYRIDFVGRPGGPLGGMSGSTTATIRMRAGGGGQCLHDPIDCSDGNPCTVDTCDPISGCLHAPLNCDDGNLCTIDGCSPLEGAPPSNPCVVTDNGSGTVTLPPAGCEYLSPSDVHEIINGLPAGTTIELTGIHKEFVCHSQPGGSGVCSFAPPSPGDCDQPGGVLLGEQECSDSTLSLDLSGTGGLAGYSRSISLPISFETHVAPRTLGAAVQSFDTQMYRLFGQIIGDPDFDLLRIVAGNDFGLPSPGHTTLVQQPGNNWAVDSFFDITYRIDFVGSPGGPLAGRSGSTTATIRMSTGDTPCTHQLVSCNDDNPCTLDSCDPTSGECVHEVIDCSDGNPCTADSCAPTTGQCVHAPWNCNDNNPCTVDSCDPSPLKGVGSDPCVVNDNGGGTVTLPPAGCDYLSPDDVHRIINGLPPGTTIEFATIHRDFICREQSGAASVCSFVPPPGLCDVPGGGLGGRKECADSKLELRLTGTGGMAGYSRALSIPIGFETHVAPRVPGAPVQSFDTEMFRLFGQLPAGDPDFDLLRIVAGNDFGLPSPGHTTLTQQPGNTWAVDSFFDITYRIDFVGHSPGPFAGRSGSTTGTIRMATGLNPCTNAPIDCNDNNPCTADSCNSLTGACVHTPLDCNDGNACTTDSCTAASGCVHAPITCADANPCTADSCNPASGCVFTPLTAPGDVSPLQHAANKMTVTWPPDPVATTYNAVRGRLRLLPVGPGGGDETCLPVAVGGASFTDATVPDLDSPMFYVVRSKNQTCPSVSEYGRTHTNPGPPLNGPPRKTTTCP